MIAQQLTLIATLGFDGYALLDSGAGRKLERFGSIVVDRPEPQAMWQPQLEVPAWKKAHAVFSASGEDDEKGKWRVDRPVPDQWPVEIAPAIRGGHAGSRGITMLCKLSGLWHLGLFPEQLPHWNWMIDRLTRVTGETPRVLNLFGYTGAASLLAAAAGAEVTHVDASKKAIAWGRENQHASKLSDGKLRWIVDDASKFAAREVRRGRSYHIILVDPPKFGRGPDGEVWDLYAHLPALLADCSRLLATNHAALVLTAYAIRASALSFSQLLDEKIKRPGVFETGELAIATPNGRSVATSLYVRWSGQ